MTQAEPAAPPARDLPERPNPAVAVTGGSVIAGGLWNIASRTLPQLYTLVVSVVAARVLGPDRMGRQSFLAFVEFSAVVLFTGGMPIALMRYVGETVGRQQPEAIHGLVRWALRIELAGAASAATILAIVSRWQGELRAAWLLAAVACALIILHTVPSSVLLGLQQWRVASLVGLVNGLVGTAATVAVLWAGGGITGMFAVEAAVAATNLAWTGREARRRLGQLAPTAASAQHLVPRARRFAGLTSIAEVLNLVVWRRSEFFFLKRYSTNAQIAFYSVAFSASTTLVRLPEAVGGVLAPAVATLFGAGQMERIRSGAGRAFRLILVVTLPLAAGSLALGPEGLRIVYGEDYRLAGPVLVVLVATLPVLPLVLFGQQLLTGLGHVRVPLAAAALATCVNLALDLVLIPPLGALGAAVASAVAQLTAGAPLLLYACRQVGPVWWGGRFLARAVVSSAGAGATAWAVVSAVEGVGGFGLGALAGLASFLALTALLPVLSPADAAWLQGQVGPRVRPIVGACCRILTGARRDERVGG